MKKSTLMLILGGAASLSATPSFGQSVATTANPASNNDDMGLQDIIVTAQRHTERLQDVPISVNVIGGESLRGRGITDTKSLTVSVPALDYSIQGSGGTPFLRGVGSTASNPNDEPSVALYVDGVYYAAPFVNLLGFNNIDRVEVLKGPQGTLFGRNATGGVVQIITRNPTQEFQLEANAGYGNYKTSSGSLYVTGGITSTIAADLALQFEKQDEGWGHNFVTGGRTSKQSNYSARSKIVFTPTDHTEIKLSGDYARRNGPSIEYRLAGGVASPDGTPSPGGFYDSTNYVFLHNYGPGKNYARLGGVSLTVNQDLGFANLVSITAYRKATGCLCVDTDGAAGSFQEGLLPLFQQSETQELQLLAPKGSAIDWLVGGFLYRNRANYKDAQISGSDVGGAVIHVNGQQITKSASIYGQATASIAAHTKVTGGLRYTRDRQGFTSSVDPGIGTFIVFPKAKQGFNKFTWRLALDQELAHDVHAYISYNRGLKSGGFDLLSSGSTGYQPETLDAYEVGLKSQFLNRRVRFNISGFLYDYRDIQVQAIPRFTVETSNAAKARIKGIDVDMQVVPVRNLTLSSAFSIMSGHYLDYPNAVYFPASRFDGTVQHPFDASGNHTIRTPKFTGNIAADYKIPTSVGKFLVSGNAYYNDGYYWDASNLFPQHHYTLLNGSIGWTSSKERYNLTLWGRNLNGAKYYSGALPSGFGNVFTPAAPRTFGATAGVKF